MTKSKEKISFEAFQSLDIRCGEIVEAKEFPRAKNPSYRVVIDFGDEIGHLQSSAQITKIYSCEDLIGKRVMACINLGERNIAGFMSQCLVLGFSDADGHIHVCEPANAIPLGGHLH